MDRIVYGGRGLLRFDAESTLGQTCHEERFISRLQQARAYVVMNLEAAFDCGLRQPFDIALRHLLCGSPLCFTQSTKGPKVLRVRNGLKADVVRLLVLRTLCRSFDRRGGDGLL